MIATERTPLVTQATRIRSLASASDGTPSPRAAGFNLTPTLDYLLLAAITVLAAALRFYKLGEWSFWIDEAYTVQATGFLTEWSPIRLPLYLLATRAALGAFGTSEWSARLVPALIGVVSIPILYPFLRRLFGHFVGLTAVLLLAISPWHIYWSQNARFYTLLLLLYTLAALIFFLGLERDRLLYLGLSVVLLVLAMRERAMAGLLVPAIVTYLVALWLSPLAKPAGFRKRNALLLALAGTPLLLYDVYLYVMNGDGILVKSLANVQSFFVGQPIDDSLRLLLFIGFSIGTPLMCLAVVGAIPPIMSANRAALFFLLGALVPLASVVLVSPFVFTKDRYIFASLPFWTTLAAIAVKELWRPSNGYARVVAAGVLLLLIAHAVESDLLYYQINNGNRRDWRGAFALIQQRAQASDVVVSTRPELGNYYLNTEVVPMEGLSPGRVETAGRRFWFVTDSESVWVMGDIKSWIEANAELVDVRALRVPEDISLRIYLYDPARRSPAIRAAGY